MSPFPHGRLLNNTGYHTSVTKTGIRVFVMPFITTGGGNVLEWTFMQKNLFFSTFLFLPSPYSNFKDTRYHTSVTKARIHVFVMHFITTGGSNEFEWTYMLKKTIFQVFFPPLIPI